MKVSAPPRSLRLPDTVASKLMYVAVVMVPFQQALTIPIGFPLKVSEITGLLAVILYLFESRKPAHRYSGAFFQWTLLVFVTASTVTWLLIGPPEDRAVGYERGLNADMMLYFGYALIVILIAWFAGTRLGPEWIGRGLGVAIRLAALWSAAQGLLYLASASNVLNALRGTQQIGTAYGIGLPRNGPFLEGNYLGFFAGVALFAAWRRKDRGAIAASLFCLLYSQSTVALVGVLAALLVVAALRPSGKMAGFFALVGLVGILLITFVDTIAVYVTRQLAKLGLISSEGFGASIEYSMRNRTATIQRGLDMSAHFPIFGVGPGRYGYWDEFYSTSQFSAGGRGIANNAYVQILAEDGVPAATCFVLLIAALVVRSTRGTRSILALAAFVAVGLNATPSWTVLPIWFAIAYLATSPVRPRPTDELKPPQLRRGQTQPAHHWSTESPAPTGATAVSTTPRRPPEIVAPIEGAPPSTRASSSSPHCSP